MAQISIYGTLYNVTGEPIVKIEQAYDSVLKQSELGTLLGLQADTSLSQQAINEAIATKINEGVGGGGITIEIVQELPSQEISTSTIYLILKQTAGTNNIYDEYIYTNNAWEKIGDTEINLTNYIQKSNTVGFVKNDGSIDETEYISQVKTINNESIVGEGNIEIVTDVDDELSDESENPVQNKGVTAALDDKADIADIPTKLSELENDKCYARYGEPATLGEGYRRLDYIETHAQNVIITEIVPNQNTGFEITYLSNTDVTTNEAPQLFNAGGRGNRNRFAVSMYKTGQSRGDIMVKTTNGVANINMGIKQVLKYMTDGSNHIVTYSDGSTATMEIAAGDWTAKDSKGNDAPIIFFGMRDNPTAAFQRFFNGRLYRFRLFNLDELEYDFVPAIRESDDKVGLYEVVNGVFYTDTRSGAADFLYGEATELLTHVSQLIIDKNIITDNNFTNAYRDQIDANANDIIALQAALEALSTFSYSVVQSLPSEDISTTTIYLLPKQTAGTNNVYDEYIYVNESWELIGDTEIDLSNYVTKDGVKTINNESILGEGNITIQGGGNVRIDTDNNWAIFTEGDDEYFVEVTKITKPNTPTISTTTYAVVTGNASVSISGDGGAVISYSLDDGENWTNGSTISIPSGFSNDADNVTKTQVVKVKATKYGKESNVGSYTITINPKVATPSLVTNNNDKYAANATVVISKSASKNALTQYTTDSGAHWTDLEEASLTITVTENKAAGVYRVRATKDDYIDSAVSQSSAIEVNKKYIYYGATTSNSAPTAYNNTMTNATSIPTADNTGVIIHTNAGEYFYFLTADSTKTKIREWQVGSWNDITTTKTQVTFTMLNGLTATYYCLMSPLQGKAKDGQYTIM